MLNLELCSVGQIIVEDNKTIKVKSKDGDKYGEVIGDFSLSVIAKGQQAYLLQLNNKLVVDTLSFTTSLQGFREWIRPKTFIGTGDDLEKMMSAILAATENLPDNNLIVLKNFVGQYSDSHLTFWVFKNEILITHIDHQLLQDPCLQKIPASQVLFFNNHYIYIDQTEVNPSLMPIYTAPDGYTLQEFLPYWLSQLKNPHLLYALLGWKIASMNLQKIAQLRRISSFPFYVLTAQTSSGKTAVLANCMKIMGVRYTGENYAASVSEFVELSEFSQVSGLPIWRDEYKNEGHAKKKESWLRSVYNRAGTTKGKANQTLTRYVPRATLLLSGEDITDDPALARRMIKMRLTVEDKLSKQDYLKITKYADDNFAKVLPLLIQAKFDVSVFLGIYDTPEFFLDDDTPERDELMCYAALGAVFGLEVGVAAVHEAQGMKKVRVNIMSQTQNTIAEFFDEVSSLFLEKGFFEKGPMGARPKALDYFIVAKKPADNTIFVRTKDLYWIMKKNRPRDQYNWTDKALSAMMAEKYKAFTEPRNIQGVSSRVCVFREVGLIEDATGDFFQKIQQVNNEWENGLIDVVPDQINTENLQFIS